MSKNRTDDMIRLMTVTINMPITITMTITMRRMLTMPTMLTTAPAQVGIHADCHSAS